MATSESVTDKTTVVSVMEQEKDVVVKPISCVKKPRISTKKTRKVIGGLNARKLKIKPSEINLYDQKPDDESPIQVSAMSNSANKTSTKSSLTSRFEYVDKAQAASASSQEIGMTSGLTNKNDFRNAEEPDEARKRFSNAKSISSAQFFGNNQDNKAAQDNDLSTRDIIDRIPFQAFFS